MKASLYTDVSFQQWTIGVLQNSSQSGRSVHFWSDTSLATKDKIQLAAHGENLPTLKLLEKDTVEFTPGTEQQLSYLQSLDTFALELLTANSSSWFGKSFSSENLASMQTSIMSSTGKWRCRLPSTCNIWYSLNGNTCTHTSSKSLESGMKCIPCFTVNGLYFKSHTMGLSLSITDMLVYPVQEKLPFNLQQALTVANYPDLPEHEEECASTIVHE